MADIVVAFPKEEDAKAVKNVLIKNGFSCRGIATSGSGTIMLTDETDYGILICAYKFEDMVYSEIRDTIGEGWDMLLICSPSRIQDCVYDGVVFLPLPLKVHNLLDTMNMIEESRYRKRRKKRLTPTVRTEEEQSIISKAKALLMDRNHMTEDQAHRYLQKTSMANGSNIVETSKMVISISRL